MYEQFKINMFNEVITDRLTENVCNSAFKIFIVAFHNVMAHSYIIYELISKNMGLLVHKTIQIKPTLFGILTTLNATLKKKYTFL